MTTLKRAFTFTKERFDNVDLSSQSSEYASAIYRRASKSSAAAAQAARANVSNAYTAAAPHVETARDNVVTTTSSLWTRIVAQDVEAFKRVDMTSLWFRRSGTAPLDITIRLPDLPHNEPSYIQHRASVQRAPAPAKVSSSQVNSCAHIYPCTSNRGIANAVHDRSEPSPLVLGV